MASACASRYDFLAAIGDLGALGIAALMYLVRSLAYARRCLLVGVVLTLPVSQSGRELCDPRMVLRLRRVLQLEDGAGGDSPAFQSRPGFGRARPASAPPIYFWTQDYVSPLRGRNRERLWGLGRQLVLHFPFR